MNTKSTLPIAALLAGALLAAPLTAQAETYAELAYSNLSIDYKPFDDAQGWNFLGAVDLGPRIEVFGWFNEAGFTPSGPELGIYKNADGWLTTGARYRLGSWKQLRFKLGASSQSVELDGDREYGYAAHAGLQYVPFPWLRIDLDVAALHLVMNDIEASATVALMLTDTLALTGRIIDHSDWDLTSYEGGIRWLFKAD